MDIPSNIEKEIKATAVGWFVSGISDWSETNIESIEDALNEGKSSGEEWELWYPFENDNPAHIAGLALDLEGHIRRIVLMALKEKDLRSE